MAQKQLVVKKQELTDRDQIEDSLLGLHPCCGSCKPIHTQIQTQTNMAWGRPGLLFVRPLLSTSCQIFSQCSSSPILPLPTNILNWMLVRKRYVGCDVRSGSAKVSEIGYVLGMLSTPVLQPLQPRGKEAAVESCQCGGGVGTTDLSLVAIPRTRGSFAG